MDDPQPDPVNDHSWLRHIDQKVDSIKHEVHRLKIGLIVLGILVVSPKLGGPAPSHVVAMVQHLITNI